MLSSRHEQLDRSARASSPVGLTLVAGPALAQAEAGLVRVAMNTGKGVITLDLK